MAQPVEFYRDSSNEWRWRVRADNGEIIAASTEGYEHMIDANTNYQAQKDI